MPLCNLRCPTDNCTALVPFTIPTLLRSFHEDYRDVLVGGHRYQLQQKWDSNGVSGVLWDSAVVLARYISSHPEMVRGKRVLELGAGLGLPSMVSSRYGAKYVRATDQRLAISLLNENMKRNCPNGNVDVSVIDWRSNKMKETFDVILGADLVHKKELFEPLKGTLEWYATPEVKILFCSRIRYPKDEMFYDSLTKSGFNVSKVFYDAETDVHIFRILKSP